MATIEFLHRAGLRRHHESRAVRPIFALLKVAASAILWLPRFWAHRTQLAPLASMNIRELQDLGLNSCDVANAFAQPNEQDPTVYLAAVARERRLRSQT